MKIKFDEKEGFILTDKQGKTYKTGFECNFFFDVTKNELVSLENSSFPNKEQPNKKKLFGVCLSLNPWHIKETKQEKCKILMEAIDRWRKRLICCLVVSYDDNDKMQVRNRSNNLGDELEKGNEVVIEDSNLEYSDVYDFYCL
jgi:hypothetical protein